MNIRTKLTALFIAIVAILIIAASVAIYFFSADYREDDFYNRLRNKGNNTAKLLIEVEEVDAALLRRIEQDNPMSLPDEKLIIYDYKNNVLFSTDEEDIIHVDQELLDEVRLTGEVRFNNGAYEVLAFLFTDRYDRFVVVAAAIDIYGINKLKNLRNILLLVIAVMVILVLASGWFYAGRALHPISKVIRQVDEITINKLDLRVDEGNGKDEIALLAKTFNDMLSRLETSFVTQKNFIANASHELRTPLTSITGQLEVTLLNPRNQEEYQTTIKSVLEDIKNLTHLSNKLLLLAQASASINEKNPKKFRIDELLWQIHEDFQRHYPEYKIIIDLDPDLDDESRLMLWGDDHLMKVALSNIIDNGCKYSENHTTEILVKPNSNSIYLHFKDTGIGIPAENMSQIFDPFHRGANTQNIKGHGIGLSMTDRIIKLHRGSIHIDSVLNKGTSITIQLPLAAKT